jgi:hypothetical protein
VITWTIRVHVKGPNERLHWAARARQTKSLRAATQGSALVQLRPEGLRALATLPRPFCVRLVRIGTRELDDDNVRGACKPIRDEVAVLLGLDDGPTAPVTWDYAQERGEPAVRVEVRSAAEAAT